ncbi:hypothetical protein lhe_0195 [Lactobacillus helveticus CNRZ32]|nr:hypothetical protein lhe_0195 [Lactobacillus helveticus CNRZ32]
MNLPKKAKLYYSDNAHSSWPAFDSKQSDHCQTSAQAGFVVFY